MKNLFVFVRAVIACEIYRLINRGDNVVAVGKMYQVLSKRIHFSMAESECQKRGYDGLAVINSPEEFNYASQLTEHLRFTVGAKGFWVALSYNVDRQKLIWIDGSEVVSDMPGFRSGKLLDSQKVCTRIRFSGVALGKINCSNPRYPICGYHKRDFVQATGQTLRSSKPVFNESMMLAQHKMESHLYCTLLCSRFSMCRVAWFESLTLTCSVLGPGHFSISKDLGSQTFVRVAFSTN
ncbi:hypothetical protein RRG08_030264 [Elysia crispata]|uniref:C-type lectin domain-containing protein n=1 Tax=Elysia crispata TaxID=231223 RepID=A0AAE1AH33_9GAST|nr:hypothetical protein RRG08_030264 [Elysia crispata]